MVTNLSRQNHQLFTGLSVAWLSTQPVDESEPIELIKVFFPCYLFVLYCV